MQAENNESRRTEMLIGIIFGDHGFGSRRETYNPLSVSSNYQQDEPQSTNQLFFWVLMNIHDYFGEPLYTLLWP